MHTPYAGKLIVFEGGDGAGKGTQSQLLLDYLEKKNIPHSSLDFPQYDTFYGKIVAQFLRGEFGKLDEVSPYLAALTFALDRAAVKDHIMGMLQEGKIVIANRYVTSNIAHQSSKFSSESEQNTFISWVEDLEYGQHGLPKEDIVIYLRVPSIVSTKLISKKDTRNYLNGKSHDIQEENHEYVSKTESFYDVLAQRNSNWITINCMKNGTILSRESIHEQVIQELQNKNII